MPQGGQLSAGSGLRLQVSSPGVQDTGNFNVSGVGIASQFTTAPAGIGNSNGNEIFGHLITNAAGANKGAVFFGAGVGTQNIYSNDNVALGYNALSSGSSTVSVGFQCITGNTVATISNAVAMGNNCNASTSVGTADECVAVGHLCNADLGVNVAMGNRVSVITGAVGNANCIGVGQNIALNNAVHLECAIFGNNISENSGTVRRNMLVVGYYGGTLSAPYQHLGDNSIQIGNTNQTVVQIGKFSLNSATLGKFKTIADSTVTNSVVPLDLTNAGAGIGSNVFAANTITLYQTLKIRFKGVISTAAAPGNMTINVAVGLGTFAGMTFALPASLVNEELEFEGEWVIRSLGAPGTAKGTAVTRISGTSPKIIADGNIGNLLSLDTTVIDTVSATLAFSVANASNTFTSNLFVIEQA